MREIDTYGHIKNGELKISYKKQFLESLKSFKDGRIILTVKRLYNKRSLPQNNYYWGVIINEFKKGWFDTQGERISTDDAHEILKRECNYKEITNEETGEILKIGISTRTKTTVEYEEYLEDCRKFVYNWFGIDVPLPNEQVEIMFK